MATLETVHHIPVVFLNTNLTKLVVMILFPDTFVEYVHHLGQIYIGHLQEHSCTSDSSIQKQKSNKNMLVKELYIT